MVSGELRAQNLVTDLIELFFVLVYSLALTFLGKFFNIFNSVHVVWLRSQVPKLANVSDIPIRVEIDLLDLLVVHLPEDYVGCVLIYLIQELL